MTYERKLAPDQPAKNDPQYRDAMKRYDDLERKRAHAYGWQVCLDCHAVHMAVWPVQGRPVLGECPECHHDACIPLAHGDGLSHEEARP